MIAFIIAILWFLVQLIIGTFIALCLCYAAFTIYDGIRGRL